MLFQIAHLQNIGTRIAGALIFLTVYITYNALINNQGFKYIHKTIKEIKISLTEKISTE